MSPVPRRKLRELLVEHFNADELHTLCSDLNVDYDSLRGEGKEGKARELIEHLADRGRLSELIGLAAQERPNVDWQAALAQTEEPAPVETPGVRGPTSAAAPRVPPRWLTVVGVGVIVVAVAVVLLVRGSSKAPPAAPPGIPPTVSTAAATAIPTLLPTAIPSATPVPPTPTPTSPPPTPTPLPTATAPTLRADYVFQEEDLLLQEFLLEPGIAPSRQITDLLRLEQVIPGRLSTGQPAIDARLLIRNADSQPIRLAFDRTFFALEDRQGQAAPLIYFCCAADGDVLAPGQVREVRLVFEELQGWRGKGGPSTVMLRVRGFRPILRAGWEIPLLRTAD